MSDAELKEIADGADVIINGYAFSRAGELLRVLNLNNPRSAAVFAAGGECVETTMDDVELSIASGYLIRARQYLAA